MNKLHVHLAKENRRRTEARSQGCQKSIFFCGVGEGWWRNKHKHCLLSGYDEYKSEFHLGIAVIIKICISTAQYVHALGQS